jgi:hypothetical protein
MAEETNDDDSLEDYELYRLDEEEETPILAAGGEALQPGDHVYMWCTLYQHHGIVLYLPPPEEENSCLIIAEFTNATLLATNGIIPSSSTASGAVCGGGVTGGFRFVREHDTQKWHKMKYQASPLQCLTWRPGTCSAASPSKPDRILQRVQFLHDCRHLLPPYHLLASNCETVAVWCVTGKWETLQYGHMTKLSSSVLGAAGGGVGIVAAGLVALHAKHIQQQWQETGKRLDKEFEWYTMGRPLEIQRFQEEASD